MSRYEFLPPGWSTDYSFAVGWDRPLETFFAQVMDYSVSQDDDCVIVWVGALPPYFADVDATMQVVNGRIRGRLPAITLTREMRERLIRDRRREDDAFDSEEPARKITRHAADLWQTTPLCPPKTMDALDAARKLHREIQDWVVRVGLDPAEVEWWGAQEAREKGHCHGGRYPLAQIVWLTGPSDWPAELLEGRSYPGGGTFRYGGQRYYLEPDRHVLSMMPLDAA